MTTPATFTCARCAFTGPRFFPGRCSGQYGTDPVDGATYCPACCALRDKENMVKEGRVSAYIASEGDSVTTWHGLALARCESLTVHRRTMWSTAYNIRARDDAGRLWVGRGGGKGMFCNLRLAKVQK